MEMGMDPEQLGWASVQLDGGIEQVMAKIETWFVQHGEAGTGTRTDHGPDALQIGLLTAGPISQSASLGMAQLTRLLVSAGGTVVVPENSALLSADSYRHAVLTEPATMPSLDYGERMVRGGFHIMSSPTSHWVELLSGIGATGAQLIVAYIGQHPVQSHPLVPVLQITASEEVEQRYGDDLDLVLAGDADGWHEQILELVSDVLCGKTLPKLHQQGNVDFQITRGLLGVSM